MKVCIVGAGAIGGMLAVKLARTGAVVSVVARGAHLEAIRARGLTLVEEDQNEHTVHIAASSALADLGQQDVVVLGMKAHQVAAVAPDLHHLLAPDTRVVTTQNGVPWWYFAKLDGPYAGQRLESVDPGGIIAAHIDVEHVEHVEHAGHPGRQARLQGPERLQGPGRLQDGQARLQGSERLQGPGRL